MRQLYIYRVSIKAISDDQNSRIDDHYFSSLSAIYDWFTPEEIGCKVTRLWCHKITTDHPYESCKCTIAKVPVMSKRQSAIK